MKKLNRNSFTIYCLLLTISVVIPKNIFATSTGPSPRNVSIDGTVTIEAANGTNGVLWELDENCGGSETVNFFYTWDNTNLYLGWTGATEFHQHIVWIDTDPQSPATGGTGSTSTFPYGGVTATLPFTGNVFLNIESGYDEIRTNSSGTWSGSISNSLNQSSSSANHLEVTVPWSSIGGKPDFIYILSYINDPGGGSGDGWVYGASPTTIPEGDYDGGLPIPSSTWYYAEVISGQAPNGYQGSLPVEMLYFKINVAIDNFGLSWATASEQNNSHFEVQRSSDHRDWNTIGIVSGQGTTLETHQYSFIDRQPLPGVSYYRLKQVDFDGRLEYSKTLVAESATQGQQAAFFPNPATDKLYFKGIDSDIPVTASIYDLTGNIWHKAPLSEQNLDIGHLPSGLFMVVVEGPDRSQILAQRFVKQ